MSSENREDCTCRHGETTVRRLIEGGADYMPGENGFLLLDELVEIYLSRLTADDRPLDPVARFHLGNGASIHRINRGGDTSRRGMERSYGYMVNYKYEIW